VVKVHASAVDPESIWRGDTAKIASALEVIGKNYEKDINAPP
jgi:hypothetical protein